MTRSASRRLWLLIIGLLLIGAYVAFKKAQTLQGDIALAEERRVQLNRDLRQGNIFSAALSDLDKFTINERQATTLDILRHLDLQESSLNYETRSIVSRSVGGVILYTRRFALRGTMSYAEALAQVDWLHNTNKVVIDRVTLDAAEGYGDVVNVQIEGTLYGLEK